MIDVKGVHVTYGKETALKDINLHVEKNTTCAILGSSGCGKTTLLYAIAGLIKTDHGEIRINGEPVTQVRKETGVILQEYGLLPWKTVWNNVIFTLKARGMEKDEAASTVEKVLRNLGIYDYKNKYPGELSGGQKQRVAIARTLALSPDLLLMDEPSSSLDAMTKEHIQTIILESYMKKPTTLVIVTHNIEEAVFLGQKIVVMGKQKIGRVINNPYFGMENIRDQIDFYKFCLEIRGYLYEEDTIC
ncbi:MAG TPA: ABC transporter ATP-binding protein [Epulopiscium sp.]|nr:ABC transporter ATP-binding protein [Candidatus Epulonipiscium sp.]